MVINLFGEIDPWGGINFETINDQLSQLQEGEKIELKINSVGGSVNEALAIYDLLRGSEHEITAHVCGMCASSATLLLLTAKKENRTATPNAQILIHNPYVMHACGDGNELEKVAQELKDLAQKFVNIYAERTGSASADLAEAMQKNEFMPIEKALELGFINKIIYPTMNKTIKNALDVIAKALGANALAMVLETATGDKIEFEKETGAPEVGDKVTAEDGSYLMPDGTTLVIAGGEITEILPTQDPNPNPEENEEVEQLRNELQEAQRERDELQKQLQEAQAKAVTTEQQEILDAVATAGGREWLASVTSKQDPHTPTPQPEPTDEGFKAYYNRIHGTK